MKARPKRYFTSDRLVVHPNPDGSMWIIAQVTHPPSAEGREISIRFDPDEATMLLKECRDLAILRRRHQPGDDPSPFPDNEPTISLHFDPHPK